MGKFYTCKTKDYISQIVFHYGVIISWIYLATRSLIKSIVPSTNVNSYSPGIYQSILSHPITLFLIKISTALAFYELFCVHLHWVLTYIIDGIPFGFGLIQFFIDFVKASKKLLRKCGYCQEAIQYKIRKRTILVKVYKKIAKTIATLTNEIGDNFDTENMRDRVNQNDNNNDDTFDVVNPFFFLELHLL